MFYIFIRSSQGDVLIDLLLEVMSVRPSVRTYILPSAHKSFFSDFDLIWYVGSPRPLMRSRMTSTRSKVKVKVTGLLKFRKLHFSRSLFSRVRTIVTIGLSLRPIVALSDDYWSR